MTETTSQRILFELKSRGPLSAPALGAQLGVSSMGARKQLLQLEVEGLVDSTDQRVGVGRPSRVFALTAAGHGRFPDTHSHLTVELLESVSKVFGETGLQALLDEREREAHVVYQREVGRYRSVARRVRALAELRSREGYMADCWPEPGGSFVLVENHCPICAAASACQGLCRAELSLFQKVLGERVSVTRFEHALSGARRCAYRIAPA